MPVVLYLWRLYLYDLFHILQSSLTYFGSTECMYEKMLLFVLVDITNPMNVEILPC
jgi:hypothetical protein